jgi:hypothetical protein
MDDFDLMIIIAKYFEQFNTDEEINKKKIEMKRIINLAIDLVKQNKKDNLKLKDLE